MVLFPGGSWQYITGFLHRAFLFVLATKTGTEFPSQSKYTYAQFNDNNMLQVIHLDADGRDKSNFMIHIPQA